MPAQGIRFEASATIHARPEIVWSILTDYQNGHPNILPPSAFSDFRVVEGGIGAGTVTTFLFHVAGSKRAVRHAVSTPAPGQTLVEAEPDGATTTTFMLSPVDDGRQTRLTITTAQRGSAGARGVIERLMAPLIAPAMQRIYQDEMQRLDALAQRWPISPQ
ncbi:MAG TPA: SRPBCC family protein [Ktedonobacterales bacterium]|nr:SRPBCC family protein [Ktedonobacterales bacterium]